MGRTRGDTEDDEEVSGENKYEITVISDSDSDEGADTRGGKRRRVVNVVDDEDDADEDNSGSRPRSRSEMEQESRDEGEVIEGKEGSEEDNDEDQDEDEEDKVEDNEVEGFDEEEILPSSSDRRKSGPFRYFVEEVKCELCGEAGHKKKRCPTIPKVCLLCGSLEHTERHCDKGVCYKCGRIGHTSKECEAEIAHVVLNNHNFSRRKVIHHELRGVICMVCGQVGHVNCKETKYSKNASMSGSSKSGRPRFYGQCCNCAGTHDFESCKSPMVDSLWSDRGFVNQIAKCFRCNQPGHIAAMCPNDMSRRPRRSFDGSSKASSSRESHGHKRMRDEYESDLHSFQRGRRADRGYGSRSRSSRR